MASPAQSQSLIATIRSSTPDGRHARPSDAGDAVAPSIMDLVPVVIDANQLRGVIPGPMVLACLQIAASRSGARERWLALFNSPLGAALATSGRDLNTSLGMIIAALPHQSKDATV